MLLNRIIRAIKLDKTLYHEVKPDESLTNEAIMVIAAALILTQIGSFLGNLISGVGFGSSLLILIIGLVLGAVGWGVFIFVAHYAGTKFFGGNAALKEMLRSLGYAQGPALLGVFGFIPVVGWLVAWVGSVLALITSVIAVRETLGVDTVKAIITCVIAWVAMIIITSVIGGLIYGPIIAAAVMASI